VRRPGPATLHAAVLATGLALSLLMVWRSQTAGDQLYLLARGWMLVSEGWIVPFGSPMSGGGCEPGSLTSLLVGLPLLLVRDYRVANLLVLATHVAAYVILDRSLRRAVGPRERLLFAVAYWLNPWRLYFSAYLWNPNWLFVLGAAHLATAMAQRTRPSFWASFAHAVILGAAFQLHASVVILVALSGLLWWRGLMRPSLAGLAAGGLLVVASLIPWMLELARHPELMPVQEGFPGRGLLLVQPALKGLSTWLRYASLFVSRQPRRLDFTSSLGDEADAVLAPVVAIVALVVGIASLAPAVMSHAWLWRRRRDLRFGPIPEAEPGREWLLGYARLATLAAAFAFALSPTTTMMWQGFIALHAAVLVLPLWCADRLEASPRRALFLRGAVTWALCALALDVTFALGSPMYRRGGRHGVEVVVREPLEMLVALRVDDLSTIRIEPMTGARSRLLRGRAAWEEETPRPPEPGEKW
jgi:hypothetical protein